MKKLIITIALIASLGSYSFYIKHPGDDDVNVTKPASLSTTQTKLPSVVANRGLADGTYTGTTEDAYYGYVQVQTTIQNGKITDVVFLQYPNDRRESLNINSQATPWLAQEAIQSQTAKVDIISGATDTSRAFVRSLSAALSQAKS
jgi:uncharacterized protein with FMN-binding domain